MYHCAFSYYLTLYNSTSLQVFPLSHSGSGGLSAGLSAGSHGDVEIKKSGSVSDEVDPPTKPGSKPPLRVYIPGQKEFVPRTVS